MMFDTYVRRFGKSSTGFSAFCVLLTIVADCGGFGGIVFTMMHVPVIFFGLGVPVVWRWLRKKPLDADARRWAWIAAGALPAAVVLMQMFDRTSQSGCLR